MNTRTEPRLDIWTTKRTGKTGGMFTVPEKDAEAAYERLCEIRNEHDAKRPPRARRPWVSSIAWDQWQGEALISFGMFLGPSEVLEINDSFSA